MKKSKYNFALIHTMVILFLLFSFNFLSLFFYIVGIIAYYSAKRSIKKKNRKHKKFDIKYFRDDLKKMSPSYISYILDFSIELEKDVAAHVLKLYIDKYIKYENNKFIVTNKNKDDLKESDICLLEFVNNNFTDPTFLERYQNLVKKELEKEGYITNFISKQDIFGFFSGLVVSILGIVTLSTIHAYATYPSPIYKTVIVLLFIVFISGIIFFPIKTIARIIAFVKYGLGKRTKKGEELLEQIYGLKNFLKDFSIIKDRKLEEVYLQEHYLVYALTLDVNTKVDDEILKKIKKHIRGR